MRKKGEYIIDKRLKFKPGLQRKFILNVKNKSGLTWSGLAKKLGLSEHTLRVDWQGERTTIPCKIAEFLLKEYPIDRVDNVLSHWVKEVLPERWGQILSGSLNKKEIKIPKKSEELAEILGVILGDGHLEKKTLTITGNINEKAHHEYFAKNITKLFNLKSKMFQNIKQHTNILKIHSTELIKFLTGQHLVLGNKITNRASFPKWIFDKRNFVCGALRGLFDTDGGIYLKQKRYKRAIIEFQTSSNDIRKDIVRLIQLIGLTPSKSAKNIRIQNQKEMDKFFQLVGSSNPKNIIRWGYFNKIRGIPLKEKLNKEIIALKIEKPFKAALV